MKSRLTTSLALVLLLASAPVSFAQSENEKTDNSAQVVQKGDTFNYRYGPMLDMSQKALSVQKNRSVMDMIEEYGAPCATYEVGDKIIYRWGSGSSESVGKGMSKVQRFELLASANRDGLVTNLSFKKKFDALLPTSFSQATVRA